MGTVVALRRTHSEIYHTARKTAWMSLTKREQQCVLVVEKDPALRALFNALQMDYRMHKIFVVPRGYSPFEEQALRVMHRFTDEVTYLMANLLEVKDLVDDYNFGDHRLPA